MYLEYTGERVIPKLMEPTDPFLLEHIARYYFATPYLKGEVLDISCGSGYGSHLIAKTCKKQVQRVLGVDIDEETIRYATQNYYHPLSRFMQADALDPALPDKLGSFDTIVSFETIEHLTDERPFMTNLYNMLRPGGTLVLSTPFGEGRGKPGSYFSHVQEFTVDEFKELFMAYGEVEIFYQRGVTIEPPRVDVHYPFGVALCKK